MSHSDRQSYRGWGRSIHGFNLLSKHVHGFAVAAVDVGEHEENLITSLRLEIAEVGHAIATDASGEIHVFLHDGHSLGVDGAKVGVFEKTNDVGLGCLLESLEGLGLEAKGVVHVLGDGSDETLERSAGKHHVDGLLIAFNLSKSDRTRLATVLSLLLHTTFSGGGLLDGLGSLYFGDGHF